MALADGNIIIGTSVDVGGISTGLAKIQNQLKKLKNFALFTIAGKKIYEMGKAAIDAASDLQEVQNIVDVAFTSTQKLADGTIVVLEDMSDKIEKLSKVSIEMYGVSEFAAKQTAGSFMAMGKAMGLSMDEASDMAVSLTEVSGDMASFLNISQDYARVALSAVYTGETETLKRYGIVLTEANLQEYAHTLGIEKSVKAMGARDKAILRYKYIMQTVGEEGMGVIGDFQRTQNNWANQLRVLKQRWEELMITIGNGLIRVLTPVLQWLNAMIGRLHQFIQLLGVILKKLLHLNWDEQENSTGGIADNIEDAVDNEEDLADATNKATKAAKKALAPFDELNNITTPSSSKSSGAGGDIDWGDLDIDLGLDDIEDKIEDLFSNISTWFQLGKFIGDLISEQLNKIDWAKIKEKAMFFAAHLAELLNGVISTDLFKSVGHTIAEALNTAVTMALTFAAVFDFSQLGTKIAEGVNEFFTTFDFARLGQAVDRWVQGLKDLIVSFFSNLDWSAIFSGIRNFFANLSPSTVGILIGFYLLKKVLAISFGTILKEALVQGLGKAIAGGIGKAFAAKSIGEIAKLFGGIGLVISGLVTALTSFFSMWKNGWSAAKTVIEGVGIAFAAIGVILLAPVEGIAGIVAAVAAGIFALSQLAIVIKEHWEEIKAWLVTAGEWFAGIGQWVYDNVIQPVIDFLMAAYEPFIAFFTTLFSGAKEAMGKIFDAVKKVIMKIIEIILKIWEIIFALDKLIFGIVVSLVKKVIDKVKDLVQKIKNFFTPLVDFIKTKVLDPLVTKFKAFKDKVMGFFTDIAVKVAEGIKSAIKTAINAVFEKIESLVNGFIKGLNTVIDVVNTLPGVNISTISELQLPRLAKGAVIPANNPFMAILGDQKSGTNIEAPLSTIEDALRNVLKAQNFNVTFQVEGDPNGIFKVVQKQANSFTRRTGGPAFT